MIPPTNRRKPHPWGKGVFFDDHLPPWGKHAGGRIEKVRHRAAKRKANRRSWHAINAAARKAALA